MINILDCTFRDGGYYNDWDFDEIVISDYISNISLLPIEYIEIGYISNADSGYYGKLYFIDDYIINQFKKANKKIAVMVDVKNFNEELKLKITSLIDQVDLFRFAINYNDLDSALDLIKSLQIPKNKIALNFMYLSEWLKNQKIISEIKKIEFAEYIYLVDSYGSCFPDELSNIIGALKQKTNYKLGFHAHNNLELAFANTLRAIKDGIDIIDSTFQGMGRGAGNLKTENILAFYALKEKVDIDIQAVGDLTESFNSIKERFNWGSNFSYFLAGLLSYPQSKVMKMLSQRFLSLKSIVSKILGVEKNISLFHELFEKRLIPNIYSKILFIGGGESIEHHSEAINSWIKKHNAFVVFISSKHSKLINFKYDKSLFSIYGKELNRLPNEFLDKSTFFVSPYSNKLETNVEKISPSRIITLNPDYERFSDSIVESSIQLVINSGYNSIYLVGFDGYINNSIKQSISLENQNIFDFYCNHIDLISLTPTDYNSLIKKSIYGG